MGNVVIPRKHFRVEAVALQKIAVVVEKSRPDSEWRRSLLNCLTEAASLMLADSLEPTEKDGTG